MTRRDEILKLIVEHFIKTAEPVGSKTLQQEYHLEVSTATIRNEMNALENDGYLEKTHTSSGRIMLPISVPEVWTKEQKTPFKLCFPKEQNQWKKSSRKAAKFFPK